MPLTYEQFRHGFANAVSEDEAKELYETFAAPASGTPFFQAATASLNPWTETKVDTKNPDRGPLLLISGQKDNTVPWAIANASYKRQKRLIGLDWKSRGRRTVAWCDRRAIYFSRDSRRDCPLPPQLQSNARAEPHTLVREKRKRSVPPHEEGHGRG